MDIATLIASKKIVNTFFSLTQDFDAGDLGEEGDEGDNDDEDEDIVEAEGEEGKEGKDTGHTLRLTVVSVHHIR